MGTRIIFLPNHIRNPDVTINVRQQVKQPDPRQFYQRTGIADDRSIRHVLPQHRHASARQTQKHRSAPTHQETRAARYRVPVLPIQS